MEVTIRHHGSFNFIRITEKVKENPRDVAIVAGLPLVSQDLDVWMRNMFRLAGVVALLERVGALELVGRGLRPLRSCCRFEQMIAMWEW